jgi:hypothetical protein
VAEREGFEPSVPVTQYARLAIWCLRPLGHLSAGRIPGTLIGRVTMLSASCASLKIVAFIVNSGPQFTILAADKLLVTGGLSLRKESLPPGIR